MFHPNPPAELRLAYTRHVLSAQLEKARGRKGFEPLTLQQFVTLFAVQIFEL